MEASAQPTPGAHSAPRRERRGAKGPPQADAGGSGDKKPRLMEASAQPTPGVHSAPRRKRRGAKGPPQADAGGSGRSPV